MTRILYNTETQEERSDPRIDNGNVEGIQEPPWVLLLVVTEPAPVPPAGKIARANKIIDVTAGTLTLGWILEDLPPPGPNYQGFYDGLIASQAYQSVITTPGKSGDQAAAMIPFLAALNEAKSGRENRSAMQAAIWLLLGQITLPPEGYAELQDLLEQNHMSGIYQLELPE